MSVTSLLVGGFELGSDVKGTRKRVLGMLARGPRGLILSTANELWIIDTDVDASQHIGHRVIVEGVVAGFDRLKADWVGIAE